MGINRETVLELINDVHRSGGFKDYNSYSYLFDQVDTMPESKEDAEPHWIPVTEQMPPINEDVLVSGDGYVWKDALLPRDNESGVLEWYHDGTYRDDYAWMPLPEHYKGVTE